MAWYLWVFLYIVSVPTAAYLTGRYAPSLFYTNGEPDSDALRSVLVIFW